MTSADPAASILAADTADDIVLPFETVKSKAKGRVVRLGAAVDKILARHSYPEPVSEALAHALALVAMLGAPLKEGARLSLQTKSDGPLGFLFVDYEAPGWLRATASFAEDRVENLKSQNAKPGEGALLGNGHLALTLDPGSGQERTQGIVAIDGTSITAAAHAYFRQSEQLPTFIRLAVARQRTPSGDNWTWRTGGLIVQHPGSDVELDEKTGDDEELLGEANEEWQRVRLLAATVEDHELIDPTLPADRLLYRLFHEEGIRAFQPKAIGVYCRCSRERVAAFLSSFSADDLAAVSEPDGSHTVTCEFCATKYHFAKGEIG